MLPFPKKPDPPHPQTHQRPSRHPTLSTSSKRRKPALDESFPERRPPHANKKTVHRTGCPTPLASPVLPPLCDRPTSSPSCQHPSGRTVLTLRLWISFDLLFMSDSCSRKHFAANLVRVVFSQEEIYVYARSPGESQAACYSWRESRRAFCQSWHAPSSRRSRCSHCYPDQTRHRDHRRKSHVRP